MSAQSFYCGLDCPNVPDLFGGLGEVERLQYSFVCIPIVHPRLRRGYAPGGKAKFPGFTRSDILLDPGDWNNRIIARVSPYINVDISHPILRQQYEDTLIEELNHFRGIGITVIVITLRGPNNSNLARIINSYLNQTHYTTNIWIQVPMENPSARAFGRQYEEKNDIGYDDTWKWWSDLHRQTDWDRRVSLALQLSTDLPSENELTRWIGEPIKCLLISTHIFLTNRKSRPVLSKEHQKFVKELLTREIQMMITGASHHGNISYYANYLQFIFEQSTSSPDVMTSYAKGWEDYLQTPLQPLSDNLDSYTYNVFEKDPVKYDYYQNAILDALKARYCDTVQCICGKRIDNNCMESNSHSTNGNSDERKNSENVGSSELETSSSCATKENDKTENHLCTCQHSAIVMVLGAGRGPLVRAVLNAAIMANVNVKVYAVEKNPTAIVTLYGQQREVWGDKVTVVADDMRKFQPDQLADIIVSELLGSFGDNELSPECLDNARHLLKDDGISIPYSYTSYLSPVMCPRLWGFARANEGALGKNASAHPLETPWVVYLQNKYEIASPQELFTFTHPCEPGDGTHVERRRWKSLKFPVSQACNLHGFSGYFSCVLYKEQCLSIVPETHSKGMISWFPIFFPIKSPISLKEGQVVEVNFWRCCSPRKVWYEWNVTSPEVQGIHNSCGKSSDMIL